LVVACTFTRARVPPRSILVLGGLLLAGLVYQSLIGGQLMARGISELTMLVYLFSLRPLPTRAGIARVGAAMAAFYVISMTLFLLTVFVPGASEVRAALYMSSAKRMAGLEDELLESATHLVEQGGLSFYLHNFGYQLACAAAFFIALAASDKGLRATKWTAAAALSAFTILLAGQRSALAGAACALLFVMLAVRRSRAFAVMAIIAAIGWATAELGGFDDVRAYNTLGRLQTYSDTESRLSLQAWALATSLAYPLGIVGAGVSYDEIAPMFGMRGALAPHNGYVTRLLWFGWPIALFVGAVVRVLWSMARRTIRVHLNRARSVWELASLAGLGAVMVNALFHNASFVTFNADTLAMMFLYAGAFTASRASIAVTTAIVREGGVR
jgi:hypothetical protein